MGRAGWVYVRGRCAISNFFSLNCGFLPCSSGGWLVSGAYAFKRKRVTGRLCWSTVVSRVARIRGLNVRRSEPARSHDFLASGPRAMATPWDQRGSTFVASVLEERGALVLPHFATRLPRPLEHRGEHPLFLDAEDDLGLLARFFRPRRS